jgi:hypothetical protein
MADLLKLAGDAAAILEERGIVACGRKKDGQVTLDCWIHVENRARGDGSRGHAPLQLAYRVSEEHESHTASELAEIVGRALQQIVKNAQDA